MDIEWSTAMANSFGSYGDTAKVYAYQGANYNNVTITDVYNHMLSDGYARVFSTSWACAEQMSVPGAGDCYAATMNARDSILLSMVIQGWTLVAASGDEERQRHVVRRSGRCVLSCVGSQRGGGGRHDLVSVSGTDLQLRSGMERWPRWLLVE